MFIWGLGFRVYALKSLKGFIDGSIIRVMRGDTRSLDCSSHEEAFLAKIRRC